jgi:hypothetical protein
MLGRWSMCGSWIRQRSVADVKLESRAAKVSPLTFEMKLLVVPTCNMCQPFELKMGSLCHTLTARSYDAWPQ